MRVVDQRTMASWWWRSRAWSRTQRRCPVIDANVRSTNHLVVARRSRQVGTLDDLNRRGKCRACPVEQGTGVAAVCPYQRGSLAGGVTHSAQQAARRPGPASKLRAGATNADTVRSTRSSHVCAPKALHQPSSETGTGTPHCFNGASMELQPTVRELATEPVISSTVAPNRDPIAIPVLPEQPS
jgi:hypothetical protein